MFFMSTTKQRIPITLNHKQADIVKKISEANEISLSKAIVTFFEYGVSQAEDDYFGEMADILHEQRTGESLSHEEFWNKVHAV